MPSDEDNNSVVVPELPTVMSEDEIEQLKALLRPIVEDTPEQTWRSRYIVACTFVHSLQP